MSPDDDPHDHWIKWNPDPADPATMENLCFEKEFNPNLRIDQMEVPGKPGRADYLEYGPARCFRYAVTHLKEHNVF
ncbi:MAG: hypothetical protein JRJ26_17920 [Deltaproteobacteria bacterium]|nr:hypothetical protein [Deltaproteobacteria bacterium]